MSMTHVSECLPQAIRISCLLSIIDVALLAERQGSPVLCRSTLLRFVQCTRLHHVAAFNSVSIPHV
jgi:hypothetical protein